MACEMVLSGHKELAKKLKRLRDTAQRRVVRPAVRKAVTPISKAAKAKAPVETKALKKSIGTKVKSYPRRGVVFGMIGPRTGFAVQGPDGRWRDPVKYAHLVALGTIHHAAHPFLRSALDENQALALKIMGDAIWLGLKKEAARKGR